MSTRAEQRPFLDDIAAAPTGDDGPLFIFCDWLEEQDDPRGEYLRLCHEIAGIEDEFDDRRIELEDRCRALEEENDWLPKLPGKGLVVLQDGFLDVTTTGADMGLRTMPKWWREHGPWVHKLSLGADPPGTDPPLFKAIDDGWFHHVRTLEVIHARLNTTRLRKLAGLPHVRSLEACSDQLRDAQMPALVALGQLESLDLSVSRITDKGLQHLSALPGLRRLALVGCELDVGAIMADLPLLEVLEAGHEDMDRREFQSIAEAGQNLRELTLSSFSVTDACVPYLAELPRLRKLRLATTDIKGKRFDALRDLAQLRTLDLGFSFFTSAGLKSVAALTQLTELILHSSEVKPGHLAPAAALTNLTTLGLDGLGITGRDLRQLAPLRKLRSLDLTGADLLDGDTKALCAFPQLRHLELEHTQIGDEGIPELANLRHLRSLDLRATQVTPRGLEPLKKLTKLRSLWLSESDAFTQDWVDEFQAAIPGLTVYV